jgi:hypothetical protein
MRKRSLLLILCPLILLSLLGPAHAQQHRPIVGFVLNPTIEAASIFDPGSDGISDFADMFEALGADVQAIDLVEPIPPSTDLIVLVGPHVPLDIVSVVRLWLHMARGNNFLLTLDPVGYAGVNTEGATSSFLQLVTNGYGLITTNTFLAEPWFSQDSIGLVQGSYIRTYADILPHPVVEPLISYGIPVQLWAARAIRVEPIGVDSLATPLLYTETAYAETNEDAFNFLRGQPAPLELNLETDIVGRLNVAGLGENTESGSRIAVVGDSEVFENGYGLAMATSGAQPLYPGNYIFAQRLAAWLLEVPVDEWPSLPSGFTWVSIDGDDEDWNQAALTTDEADTTISGQYDIRRVRAFENGSYLYVIVETTAPSTNEVRVDLELGREIPRQSSLTTVSASLEQVAVLVEGGDAIPAPDAAIAVGNMIELRIPLRLAGSELQVSNLCLYDALSSQTDCVDQSITVRQVNQPDPFDTRFPEGPLVTVSSTREIVLRQGPGTDFAQVAVIGPGRVLAATGRNAAGDWIYVETASNTGWVAVPLVVANNSVMNLPIVSGS